VNTALVSRVDLSAIFKIEAGKVMSKEYNGKSWMLPIVAALVAYIGSKLIFGFFNFEYDPFTDSFNVFRLFIDFAVFLGLFIATFSVLEKVLRKRHRSNG
jgi:H+/Cl- antiporter ClcA